MNRCAASPNRWVDESVPLSPLPPQFASCGRLARRSVVWFGESIDEEVLARSLSSTNCYVFLAIGTSPLVQPAASLTPEAKCRGEP